VRGREDREKYLEAIDYFIKLYGYARPLEIAEHLKVTPASVSQMLRKLAEDGLINYQKYRGMTLTEKGKEILKKLDEKEQSIYELFVLMGCDKKIAYEKACIFEHLIDDDLAARLKNFVNKLKEKEIVATA